MAKELSTVSIKYQSFRIIPLFMQTWIFNKAFNRSTFSPTCKEQKKVKIRKTIPPKFHIYYVTISKCCAWKTHLHSHTFGQNIQLSWRELSSSTVGKSLALLSTPNRMVSACTEDWAYSMAPLLKSSPTPSWAVFSPWPTTDSPARHPLTS